MEAQDLLPKLLEDRAFYENSGGADLINGTVYQKNYGKTLVGGTAYEVGFVQKAVITFRRADNRNYSTSIVHNGTTYTDGATFEANVGDVIVLKAGGSSTNKMFVNCVEVGSSTYEYTVVGDATISTMELGMFAACVSVVDNGEDYAIVSLQNPTMMTGGVAGFTHNGVTYNLTYNFVVVSIGDMVSFYAYASNATVKFNGSVVAQGSGQKTYAYTAERDVKADSTSSGSGQYASLTLTITEQ
jgi:hypothetical protein